MDKSLACRWEYKKVLDSVMHAGSIIDEDRVDLNKMGEDGWELTAVTHDYPKTDADICEWYIFKRPLL